MNAPAASAPLPNAGRSHMVDAWRALACLAIVLYHGTESLLATRALPALAALGRHGWLGVPVFFVISGYCLAQTIERRALRRPRPAAFWIDRACRIYPAYWCAFTLALALAWVATPFNGLPPASAFPASPLAWLGDLSLVTTWLGLEPRLLVSWSLDYEIGFYVLVGFALLQPFATPPRRLGLYGALTALAHVPGSSTWFPLLNLWPQFACGLAVHAALSPGLPGAARALAALYPGALAVALLPAGIVAAFAPLAAIALLLALAFETRLPRPPTFLAALGVASYSIYLAHVPVMSPAINLVRRMLAPESPFFAPLWLAHLGLGVIAGLVFHHFIERRLERLRTRLATRLGPALNTPV